MSTMAEIRVARKEEHDEITQAYYKDKTMSEEEFDEKHSTLDTRHDITKADDYIKPTSETSEEKIRAEVLKMKDEGLI